MKRIKLFENYNNIHLEIHLSELIEECFFKNCPGYKEIYVEDIIGEYIISILFEEIGPGEKIH